MDVYGFYCQLPNLYVRGNSSSLYYLSVTEVEIKDPNLKFQEQPNKYIKDKEIKYNQRES